MISKTDYHVFRVFISGIVFIFLFQFFFYSLAIGTAFPTLINGRLYTESSVAVPIQGVVLDYYVKDTAIMFVAKNKKEILAGYYNIQNKNITQFPVTTYSDNTQIKRIAFELSAIYICIYEKKGSLYRADVNTGFVEHVGDVSDFLLLVDNLIILKSDNTLVCNDFIFPLYFTGKPAIKGHMDNRIVFIADDNDTEIIDIKGKRAIYRYSNNVQFAISSNYTVEITINDVPTNKAFRVFYKIYCNGQDYGRTEPVLSINQSLIQLNLAPGQYHEIVIERWRLDEASDRYVRDNNIRQPKPITLFVYPGRIISLCLTYTGLEYKAFSGFKIMEK